MLMSAWAVLSVHAETHILTVGFVTAAGGLGDDAYTDLTYQGIRRAQRQYAFQLKIEQPDKTGTVCDSIVEDLLQDSDLLIFLGSQHSPVVKRFASQYPEKKFINIGDPLPGQPNLLSIVFRDREGAFLAGAAAAWMSRSRTVGFLGATDLDVIQQFRAAFSEGAAYADKNVRVREAYIVSGADSSGFTMPQKAFDMAVGWYRDGVDIIFPAAGPSGLGVLHAARKENKFAIGVDTDQDHMAKGHVLTSMMKRTDRAVYSELCKVMKGTFTPGVRYYGLKEGGVGLSPMKFTRHIVPEDVLKRLNETERMIISGEIHIGGMAVTAAPGRGAD